MKRFCLLLFIIFFKPCLAHAYDNEFALKFGVAYAYTRLSEVEITNQLPLGFALSSHVGYRRAQWEYNMSSYITFSKLKSMSVEANGSEIVGDGRFMSVTFGPTLRYYFLEHPTKNGIPYLVGGIHAAVQTMDFGVSDTRVNGGNFSELHKLQFEGYGTLFGIGLDKNKKGKENYFMELVYMANGSRKTNEVGGTNTQVELITTEKSKRVVFEHTFILSIGATLF